MPFDATELQALKDDIQAALDSQRLTHWQQTFLSDMQQRFARYGTRTRLSDKQWAALRQNPCRIEAVCLRRSPPRQDVP